MTLTQINHEIGVTQPDDDCIAVALLSETAQRHVLRLLESITQKLGDAIWPMPASALHVTLCEIIQPKPYAEDKNKLLKNTPHYEAVLEEVLSISAINVTFRAIEVSPQAIIIRGEDDGTFNHIREQLVQKLPLPAETKMPPDIIHCSIARFTKEIDIEEVRAAIEELSVDFIETVREFQLLRESAPHLLSYTVGRRYQVG